MQIINGCPSSGSRCTTTRLPPLLQCCPERGDCHLSQHLPCPACDFWEARNLDTGSTPWTPGGSRGPAGRGDVGFCRRIRSIWGLYFWRSCLSAKICAWLSVFHQNWLWGICTFLSGKRICYQWCWKFTVPPKHIKLLLLDPYLGLPEK